MAQPPAAKRQIEITWQPSAECVSKACSWVHATSSLTRERAKDHARYYNHKVRIVVETVAVWSREDYDEANDKDGIR